MHKRDPGYLAITCIYYQKIRDALCDLGASVNLMSNAMFERLGYPAVSLASMTVQLVDALEYWYSSRGLASSRIS
jgi:hypothetical protein